ncbi:MAG: hypothetical protein LBF97_03595 [Elusimicrobiota bacterium]|nr:hypothetical protein [Elusimicrobiota bacterium]
MKNLKTLIGIIFTLFFCIVSLFARVSFVNISPMDTFFSEDTVIGLDGGIVIKTQANIGVQVAFLAESYDVKGLQAGVVSASQDNIGLQYGLVGCMSGNNIGAR